MNEWGVVSVLIVLIGLFTTVGKPLMSLNKSIVTLNLNVEGLKNELVDQKSELVRQREHAHESHGRLWDHNTEQDKKLGEHGKAIANHEYRIKQLEETN